MENEEDKRYPCPCCGFLTMFGPVRHTFDICAVCGWEDDVIQTLEPDLKGEVNAVSLNQARANYAKFRAKDREALSRVRPPLPVEVPSKEVLDFPSSRKS